MLRLLLLQAGEDGFGGLAMGQVTGVDTDGGGLAVERFARAVEFLDGAAGGVGLKERALAVFDPLVETMSPMRPTRLCSTLVSSARK